MIRGKNRKVKKIGVDILPWFRWITILLTLLLLFDAFLLTAAYRHLNQSIQSERIVSIEQMSILISEKLRLLRANYEDKIRQAALVIMSNHVQSLEQGQELLLGFDQLYLLAEDGTCTSLTGEKVVLSESKEIKKLKTSDETRTDFCTVQTKGDFWVFMAPLRNTEIGGQKMAGVFILVDSSTYARNASTALYENQGASYVVDPQGVIKLRPTSTTANHYFGGYNLLKILQEMQVDEQQVLALQKGLKNQGKVEFIAKIKGETWRIQSFPESGGNSIVIVVPISITARTTYDGMRNVIIMIGLTLSTVVALALVWIYYFVKKGQQSKLEQAKANLKSDFMNKVSHDIRTPLTAVIGLNDLVLHNPYKPDLVADCARKAKMSGEYLISIINDVLDMSRIESGKLRVTSTAFDMKELLETVVQLETYPSGEKGLNFRLDCPDTFHRGFLGDPVRIKQCLVNLLSNAIKFTPEHGTVTFTYREERVNGEYTKACFVVEDTGIGMSDEFMRQMFHPFEQAQSSLTSSHVGSGLGLAIVHSLVTLMNGTIYAESKLMQGSKFVIELLLERTVLSEATEKEKNHDTVPMPAYLIGKRILLAEDNEINREIITDLLTELGVLIDGAENGAEALERFQNSASGYYSMILMDIQMPVMNGLDAAAAIRGTSHTDSQSIPIVALSANAFEEDVENSLAHGMQAHISKPVDIDTVKRVFVKYIH
ncbi:hybrid sensor histidine kinase/response regulator [Lactonifactor longoviformis]|uniref:Circadian input-output histidine kinase CikA n=1 Tax=Lactonifactor longoviformis DSM 17459 TaxID=1122155 RepID=A0A1M5BYP6_9CLOT|nr:ATP-binding protein [Lactonifactor longoviformis]POP33632.1 hybrid sensor histidine kinase/response regulator [Lactonifactor longoviformis]SHF47516.1 His Kinase A (phospho-acceptor) domain-containing protein [Lactonifactor longoviformis DSM 17459]